MSFGLEPRLAVLMRHAVSMRCLILILTIAVFVFSSHGPVTAEEAAPPQCEAGSAIPGSAAPAIQQPDSPLGDLLADEILVLTMGDSRLLRFEGLLRAAVGDPKIADVAVVSDKELVLNGRSPGKTTLHVWDKAGVHFYRVEVDRQDTGIAKKVSELIGLDGITVKMANETILLEGTVSKPEDKLRAEGIAKAYSDKVLNLISVIPEKPAPGEVTGAAAKTPEAEAPPKPPTTEEIIRKLSGLDGIRVTEIGDTLLLDGEVPTQNDLSRVQAVAGIFGKKVVNLLSVKAPLQVLLQVQVVEARRNAGKDLGIRWGGVTGQGNVQLPGTNLADSTTPEIGLLSPQIGLIGEVFVGSALERLNLLRARIDALASEGLVKLLAAPSMLTLSGSEANFLVGGEIPIFLGDEGGRIKFEWKPYGVQLKITPVVERQGYIDLKVNPEVSSFDWENALLVNGWKIPAFKTRRAEGHLILADGSTMVLGGLIQSEDTKVIDKIPLLGDIPIIGALFRSEKFQRQETELLIFVTPRIVGAGESISLDVIKHPVVPDASMEKTPEGKEAPVDKAPVGKAPEGTTPAGKASDGEVKK